MQCLQEGVSGEAQGKRKEQPRHSYDCEQGLMVTAAKELRLSNDRRRKSLVDRSSRAVLTRVPPRLLESPLHSSKVDLRLNEYWVVFAAGGGQFVRSIYGQLPFKPGAREFSRDFGRTRIEVAVCDLLIWALVLPGFSLASSA